MDIRLNPACSCECHQPQVGPNCDAFFKSASADTRFFWAQELRADLAAASSADDDAKAFVFVEPSEAMAAQAAFGWGGGWGVKRKPSWYLCWFCALPRRPPT